MKTLLTITMLASLTGCGTLVNLGEKDAQPYGGVVLDPKIIGQGVPMGPFAFFPNFDVPGLWPLALIDIPMSLIGDTVTLPITIQQTAYRKTIADQLQSGQPAQPQLLPASPPYLPPLSSP
jgi:uncharacterized protein YceK